MWEDGVRLDIQLYGIPNCDTVKRARAWLAARGRAHGFHDYKKDGVDPARLARWADTAGWERLLNTRGTTFRKLPEGDRADLASDKALALMVAHPSLIKRPVVEHSGGLLVGFDEAEWAQALG
jgi:Spx/MgsR family transcriptional regulator